MRLAPPLITLNAFDEVVYEWWHGRKELTIIVGDEGIRCLKSWNDCAGYHMVESAVQSLATLQALWAWLQTE